MRVDARRRVCAEERLRLRDDRLPARHSSSWTRTASRFDAETRRPRTDPETLESERKGIYLAGVLVAGMHTNEIFIENGRFHGAQIAEAIVESLRRP